MQEETITVLIIDDEPGLAQMAKQHLQLSGYRTLVAYDGHAGLRMVFDNRPNLVVLDIMMPGIDGYETCRRIREMSDIPIILLTARDSEEDILKGFEAGADDYMIKPFKPSELIARIGAVLRRAQMPAVFGDTMAQYQDDWLRIDLTTRLVEVEGNRIRLSATEFNLLALLLRNRGRIVETNTILTEVWGAEYRDEVSYVRVYVSHLRQKLEPDPTNPRYILTERQVGYLFSVDS